MGENPAPHHVVERLTWEKKLGCFSNGNGRIIAHGGDKMKIQGNALARNVTLAIVTFSMICAIGVHAQTYKVLHTFDYTDGSQPITPLVFDPQGNLYGTTFSGGLSGRGTVFKLSPNGDGTWTESVLHNFDSNGDDPEAPVVLDGQGNIYGETPGAGVGGSYGTVFELSPNSDGTWTEHIIHAFTNGRDGAGPNGGVVLANGNKMYGVAEGGATHLGLVFSLDHISATNWHELVLHPFTGGADGEYPGGPLTLDSSGNLYGVTGGGSFGNGTVFKLTPNPGSSGWTKSLLYTFNRPDGTPNGGLIFDAAGNIYGTCHEDGTYGWGTVYKLTQNPDGTWIETALHEFQGYHNGDGQYPNPALVMDAHGNLYGTTAEGGSGCDPLGCGTIFKLTPLPDGQWLETILHEFTDGNDGGEPLAGLISDRAGNLYGVAYTGGANDSGVVFELTP